MAVSHSAGLAQHTHAHTHTHTHTHAHTHIHTHTHSKGGAKVLPDRAQDKIKRQRKYSRKRAGQRLLCMYNTMCVYSASCAECLAAEALHYCTIAGTRQSPAAAHIRD